MIRSTRLSFPGSTGAALDARYDHPVGRPRATALFAHCFTCSKDLAAVSRVSRALASRGIGVLRFDFTGLGHSEGEFANTSFSSNIEDLVRAADHLRSTGQAPSLLIGHSLGGTAVLAAADRVPEASAVVTIAAPSSPAHLARLFTGAQDEIERTGEAEVEIAGRRFTVSRQMLDDLEGHPLGDRIGRLRKALLVMHAPLDQVVGIDDASEIFVAARHPKSFVSLDEADHLLTSRRDAEYAAEVIVAWAGRYLPSVPEEERETEPGTVLVEETGYGRYANDVVVGPHVLRADEPRGVGGDDTGPSPYGYLAAALGACTSMTLRMYAERKEWPLEKVSVAIRHEKIHAEDCEACETETGKIDRFDRTLRIEGPLDAEQRQRLAEIADRCPVHRTLHSEVEVRTFVEEGEEGEAG
jgi:putative redox protein